MKAYPIKFWVFASSSGERQYQTLQWSDGKLSCDCPGWTRRNPPTGRTCRHVRAVQAGCVGVPRAVSGAASVPPPVPPVRKVRETEPLIRSFNFEE